MGIELRLERRTLDIYVDGEPFAVYNYAPEHQALWRPYFHPVLSAEGRSITQDGEFPGTSRGHYWHQGLFIAHQKFTQGNTWEEEEGRCGRIIHVDFEEVVSGEGCGHFIERLDWRKPGSALTLLRERRTVRIPQRPPERRVLDFEIELTPVHVDTTFEATPYHFLACRVADSMVVLEQKQQYSDRYGALVDFAPLDRGGLVLDSAGRRDQDTLGVEADWIDFSGPLGEGLAGVTLMSHPGNFRHPPPVNNWNNMTIALSPTFHEPYTVLKGETLRLLYRALFHSGEAETADVAGEYQRYAAKPAVIDPACGSARP